jgi:hypothetical protein
MIRSSKYTFLTQKRCIFHKIVIISIYYG